MRKLTCSECGKRYDYDVDDFCPKCGAFNRPAQRTTQRVDGINEGNHQDSFLHTEMHEENRDRRSSGLSRGVQRVPQGESGPLPLENVENTPKRQMELDALGDSFKKIIGYIVGGLILLYLLAGLVQI